MSNPKSERVAGYVETGDVLKGTGSEHQGIILTTDLGERLRLQRIGGNPFSDPVTRRLIGHKVSVMGYRLGGVFRYKQETLEQLS